MFKSLLDSLNVRPEERLQVMLMLGAGFFMGIFFATYSVVAESLFLNNLGGELNKAFLVSGFLGIVATVLFSTVQNWIKFSNLTTATILFVVIITAFFYIGFNYGPADYQKPIIFLMFCMTGPITAVLLLSYWGVFGRLFNFKQSKRIIGWIDTGQLIAVILANILIPLTAAFFPATDNYLIVCIVAILVSAVHFIIISFRFPLIKNDPKEFDRSVRKETGMVKVLTDPYTKLLSLFLIISMVTLILGQFTFQELIKVQYPNQRELTNFLAYFNGAIYALSFIMQTFVNDKLVSNYGIRISLMVLPIVVGLFSVSASLTGLILGYTPEMAATNFIYFFLFIALIRLFNNMIRDSLETPMFKLLFIPIDSKFRFGIQSKVEGVVNETGRITAGLLIFLFATLPFFKIVWMPIILTVLIGLYFILIKKLYAGYKSKIRSKLETLDSPAEKLEVGYGQITQKLEARLVSDKPGLAVFASKLLEKINPNNMSTWINTLIRNGQEETRDYAQRKMNEMKGLSVSDRYVIRFDKTKSDVSDKNLLTKAELEMIINAGGDITKSRILRLTRSHEAGDRQYAAELLLHASSDENTSFLIELLSDPEPKVRNTAIKTSIKKNSPEVVLALIENLSNPQFSNQAMSALVQIGGKALSQLDSSFYRSGQSTQILIRLVQIIGRIGGQRAKDLLWNKIDYPDKVVVSKVLLAMGEAGFKAGIAQISRIKFAIENDIGDISWNLGAIADLGNEGFAKEVKTAVRAEILSDIDHVYMLMAMLYDTRSIQLVKENIESGTVEGTAFAIELLDVFLSEQLKERVIPVLDELADQDRIKKLEVFYPRIELDEKLVLKFLINRDFTQTNRWTKACVLRQIGLFRIQEFTLDLIAQLFNPDRLIREMAAWALHEIDPQLYDANASRLGYEIHKDLDRVIKGNREKLLLFDEILFLGSVEVFAGISGLSLSFLADIAETVIMEDKDSLSLDERTNNNFYIVYYGEVDYYHQGVQKGVFRQGQFIGEMLSRQGFAKTNTLLAKEKTILMRLNKDLLYELLAENVKLADRILDYV
jgi:AAA family ATP:ADP antiporter